MNLFKKRASISLRRAESGNAGGDYAFTVYSTFLIGVMMVGICFALIGFWRIGASYAAQRSAQIGAVAPDKGMPALSAFFSDWTGASSAPGGFGVDVSSRTAISSINTQQSFQYMDYFGKWTFQIGGQTMSRSERFYPGKPICNEDGCDE